MDTIIVVDDDKVFRNLLTTVLNLEGYEAVLVSKPEEVVPTVRQANPALILMDVHIDRDDTLGVLQTLKQDEVLSQIPIIMTSGMDRSRECLNTGADAFVLKPFRPSEILSKIKEFIH